MDSDDWIQKDYLEVMVKEFDQETDIVVGKYTLYDSTLGFSYVPYESEKADYIFEGEEKEKEIVERHLNAYPQSGYILKNTLMPVWKNLYRHQMLYDNNIFFINERIVGAEDYVFNFEAYYYAKKIKLSSSAGYVHQIVEGSLSRQYHSDSIERGFNKCEVIRTSIESKSFFHKKAILYALKCEKLRIVLGSIYSIALSNSKEKVATIKRLLSDSRVIDVLDNVRRPNLENKYRIIFALLRFGGVKVTCAVLNMVGKKYKIYRKLEYRTRN